MLFYEAEFGNPIVTEEIWPNTYVFSFSLDWDMLRGVARQYGRPSTSYLVANIEGGGFSAGQVSIPFEKRWLWFNYLSGATFVDFREDPGFYARDKDKVQQLSRLGRTKVEWYEQVKKHPDRGVRATPIAIAFDYSYLLTADLKFANGGSDAEESRAFSSLAYGQINSPYPIGLHAPAVQLDPAAQKAQENTLCPEMSSLYNRPFGEVFDWVMLNAPSGAGEKALQNYRALYLLSRLDATPALTAALNSFLKHGGIVIAQASQLPLIPEEFRAIKVNGYSNSSEDIHAEAGGQDYAMTNKPYHLANTEASQPVCTVYRDNSNRPVALWSKAGKGGIFWVLGDFAQANILFPVNTGLLKQLADHALPVKVTGDIQWLANKTKDGWVIGLLNNRGVSVKAVDPYNEMTNPGENKEIAVEYAGSMTDVREWITGEKIPVKREGSGSSLSVTVPAGDIRIVQFRSGPIETAQR